MSAPLSSAQAWRRACAGLGRALRLGALAGLCAIGTPMAPAWAQAIGRMPPPEPPAAAASGAGAEQLLTELILHSRHEARLVNGRLQGPAADRLRGLGAAAQYVLLGEQHGNRGIADFASAFWADLAEAGYRYAAIEADPWVGERLERRLRAGGVEAWAADLPAQGGARSLPFFGWDAEARFAAAVVQTAGGRRAQRPGRAPVPALWALDQVFIGTAPARLREIAAASGGARSAQARALARSLAADADADPQWLGRVDPERLQALVQTLRGRHDKRWRVLAQAMLDSRLIYGPFSGGGGEPWIANTAREDGMRAAFAAQARRAEAADGRAPRVLLKLGAWHLFRGASPVFVQGLGGFVAEWAAARGQASLSVLVLCGPGSLAARHDGEALRCDTPLSEGDWRFLAPHVPARADGLTLFDLRSWRLRPRRLAGLPPEVLRVLGSYDLLVWAPTSPASRFLTDPP